MFCKYLKIKLHTVCKRSVSNLLFGCIYIEVISDLVVVYSALSIDYESN